MTSSRSYPKTLTGKQWAAVTRILEIGIKASEIEDLKSYAIVDELMPDFRKDVECYKDLEPIGVEYDLD